MHRSLQPTAESPSRQWLVFGTIRLPTVTAASDAAGEDEDGADDLARTARFPSGRHQFCPNGDGIRAEKIEAERGSAGMTAAHLPVRNA